MRTRWLAILGLGALAAACTGGPLVPPGESDAADSGLDAGHPKDGGTGALDGGLALGSACSVFGARRCAFLQRCNLIGDTSQALRDCQSYFSATSCRSSRWPARVDAGTLRYDPVTAQACADAYLARACADFQADPAACAQFLSPGSVLSGPCYGQFAECKDSVCRGTACPRTCLPPGVSDEPCGAHGDCRQDAGLYCRFGAATPGVGKCTALGAFGQGCGVDLPCSPELFCNNLGQCETRRHVGDACIEGTCVESAWCHFSPQDGGFCEDRMAAAEACTDDVQCRPSLLCEPLTGACEGVGPVADGGACSVRQRCAPSNVCFGASVTALGTCLAASGEGGSCLSSADCQAHLSCAAFDGGTQPWCGTRQPTGGPCEANRDCQLLSRCVNRSCVALPLPGNPCVAGQCLYGACDSSADGGPLCSDVGGPGAACLTDLECGSNRCVSGHCLAACGP